MRPPGSTLNHALCSTNKRLMLTAGGVASGFSGVHSDDHNIVACF
jgi:hypothetical protein